jgi:DNA repair exonuclease SbcCD ATPase subunit
LSVEEQVEELRRQIDQLESTNALSAKLIEMKENGEDDPTSEEYQRVKHELREARAAQRSGANPGTANPSTIEATFQED